MSAAPALTRVGLRLGDRTVDVAVPHGVPVYEVLRAAGVALDDPALVVVDSGAQVVDVYAVTGDQLLDGAVLHVVRSGRSVTTGTTRSARADGGAGPLPAVDPVATRPAASPWWLAVAGAGAVVLAAIVGLEVVARTDVLPDRRLVALLLLLPALALAGSRPRPGAFGSTWPTVVAAAVAFSAGAVTADPTASASGRLAVVAGLAAATAVTAVRWAATRRHRDEAADLAAVLLVVLAACAAVTAVVLFVGLPAVVGAGALLGAVPLALRALPSLSIDVPDEQLLDITPVARTVSVVRAPEPVPLGRVNDRMVLRAVGSAERRRDTGAAVLGLLATVSAPVLLVSAPAGPLTGWTSIGAVVLVALVLGLAPRTVRSATVRWALRIAAVVLLVEVAVVLALAGAGAGPAAGLVPSWLGVVVTAVALGLGLLVASVSLALSRGWRSVGFSRAADALEGLVTVLALPVALVGAGAIEALRTLTS